MPNEVMTPEQVASRLGITVDVVRRWLVAGKLPGRKFGRVWRIESEELKLWRKGCRNGWITY
jgi:excisionase family DNA binding protein